MSYQETQIGVGATPNPRPLPRKRGSRAGSGHLPGQSGGLIEERLDRLGAQLARADSAMDSAEIEDTLLLLSADIRCASSDLGSGDYRWILERLTKIYAQGFGQRAGDVFTTTADSYAQLIETISRAYPGYDYSEAVGQLFCYMTRLFRTRKNGWKTVYEHILSIPDAVEAKQALNRAFFVEIQEWAEAGVENLFSIRKDLYDKIGAIEAKIRMLDRRITAVAGGRHPEQVGTPNGGPNIVDFAEARRRRVLEPLQRRRKRLVEEKTGEEAIVELIESDIREFEEKLRTTRRAYFIHSV